MMRFNIFLRNRSRNTIERFSRGVFALVAVSLVLTFLGCSKRAPAKAPEVNAKLAYELVDGITAIRPRGNGGAKTAEAVKFMKSKITATGAKASVQKWKALTPEGMVEFNNVIAEIPGESAKFAVIGSHFDTKKIDSIPDFAGANDSGSSTGLLLAMIKAIKDSGKVPPLSLRFVFFDGEECFMNYNETDGLYGSKHYVQELEKSGEIKNCVASIILDMIGDQELYVTLPTNSDKGLANKLFAIAKRQGNEKYFGWYRTGILDDHAPFLDAGIPAIDLIDFEFGPKNIYWHTAGDTMDKISEKSLKIVGDATLQLIWELNDDGKSSTR